MTSLRPIVVALLPATPRGAQPHQAADHDKPIAGGAHLDGVRVNHNVSLQIERFTVKAR